MSGSDPIALIVAFLAQEEATVRAAESKAIEALLKLRLEVNQEIDAGLEQLGYHRRRPPRYLLLLQPIFTDSETGKITMADIQLPLNQTYTAVITEFNPTTQSFDPVASTDVFTAVVSDTTNASATIAPFVPPPNASASQTALAGIPAVTFSWLHTVSPLLTGITCTISDSAGNTPDTGLSFAMLAPNVVPDQLGIDSADAVLTTVPTPV
jgi:hypothetical protein